MTADSGQCFSPDGAEQLHGIKEFLDSNHGGRIFCFYYSTTHGWYALLGLKTGGHQLVPARDAGQRRGSRPRWLICLLIRRRDIHTDSGIPRKEVGRLDEEQDWRLESPRTARSDKAYGMHNPQVLHASGWTEKFTIQSKGSLLLLCFFRVSTLPMVLRSIGLLV